MTIFIGPGRCEASKTEINAVAKSYAVNAIHDEETKGAIAQFFDSCSIL